MTSQIIHQPHDKLFKKAMQQPAVAREFFAAHLPAEILKRVDLSTLKLKKETFIDDAFKSTEADLVYSVKLDNNATAYIYLLCENQSDVDDKMPFRLLGYTMQLLQAHVAERPNSPLPVIFPLVLYSGEKPWTAPKDIFPLFGEQADLARSLWSQPYILIDIHRITDDELKRHDFSGLMEYVLKYRQTREIEKILREIFTWMDRAAQRDLQQAILLSKNVVVYFSDVNQAADTETFNRLAATHLSSTPLRGEIMTLAQQFEQKGRHEGEAALMVRLLARRFNPLPAAYISQIEQAKPEQLMAWEEKILDAKTLHEIFGH